MPNTPEARLPDTPEARLKKLGLSLPALFPPGANYIPSVRTGNLLFLAQMCRTPDGKPLPGKFGASMSVEQGYQAAQNAMLNILAVAGDAAGGLDRIRQVVRMFGMVNATPDFDGHAKVMNGASDLLVGVFGERGRHARAVAGHPSLPSGVAIEIECVLELAGP